jgi:ABC-type lipoprotein release transport system permease subunit
LLKAHDIRTLDILAKKRAKMENDLAVLQDEMRKSMLKLSFNLLILPKDVDLRNWHSDDFAAKYMPEAYADKLAESRIVSVQHILPTLQQKIVWPERNRTVILVGTRGEVTKMHRSPKGDMVQSVPAGTMVLGYELSRTLKLNPGDKAQMFGREFTVHKCHEERGSRDDMTVWIPLAEAQGILDKKGLINGILALECLCATSALDKVRSDVAAILPDTQVTEFASRALARAEARSRVAEEEAAALRLEEESRAKLKEQREAFADTLVPLIILASTVWIAILGFVNVRERRSETGILRAIGMRSRQILTLFLAKSFLMGLAGGIIGCAAGAAAGRTLGAALDQGEGIIPAAELVDAWLLAVGIASAVVLAVVAGLVPAVLASRQDPAEVLREE